MTREDFGTLLKQIDARTGIEPGVAAGYFSNIITKAHKFEKFYCIDRYMDHHNLREFAKARELLGDRAIFCLATFHEAVQSFEDDSLDFIYIDGYAHTGQEGGETLRDWFPKLRSGGLFAGHDYCKSYPQTIKAVDEFLRDYEINVTDEKDYPSWWVIKK